VIRGIRALISQVLGTEWTGGRDSRLALGGRGPYRPQFVGAAALNGFARAARGLNLQLGSGRDWRKRNRRPRRRRQTNNSTRSNSGGRGPLGSPVLAPQVQVAPRAHCPGGFSGAPPWGRDASFRMRESCSWWGRGLDPRSPLRDALRGRHPRAPTCIAPAELCRCDVRFGAHLHWRCAPTALAQHASAVQVSAVPVGVAGSASVVAVGLRRSVARRRPWCSHRTSRKDTGTVCGAAQVSRANPRPCALRGDR